jgi:hypothetical protein
LKTFFMVAPDIVADGSCYRCIAREFGLNRAPCDATRAANTLCGARELRSFQEDVPLGCDCRCHGMQNEVAAENNKTMTRA